MSTNQHGGKRTGAGRKATLTNPVNKLIRFESQTVEDIEEMGFKFADFVRDAVDKKVTRLKKNKGS